MSQEAERVYTINLGKVWLSPDNQRAKRAINMIKEFARHHMKTEQIRIDQDLSQAVWKRGIRSPPRKIRVKMAKTDEGHIVVSTYEEEDKSKTVEEKVEEKSKDKKAAKQPDEKVEPEEKIEKVEAKVEEPKEKLTKTEKKPEGAKAPEAKKEAKTKKTEAKKKAKKSDAKRPAKKSK
ncbi:MAG: 50S ribosomal protein L31e [Nitrososphaerota archaeon]